jgi:hypothetical protein
VAAVQRLFGVAFLECGAPLQTRGFKKQLQVAMDWMLGPCFRATLRFSGGQPAAGFVKAQPAGAFEPARARKSAAYAAEARGSSMGGYLTM